MIALLTALALLQAPAPTVGPDAPPAAVLSYRDGALRVAAQRLTATSARLTWPDGRATTARLSRDAIARLPLTPAARAALADRAALTVVRPLSAPLGLYLVRSRRPAEDGLALAARLADDAALDILPDLGLAHRRASFVPPADDPRRGGQWYLNTIGIDAAWAVAVGDPGTVIAVVDNGCDLDHPDLAANMLPGRDLVDDDDVASYAPRNTGNAHGTACAGLIAAVGDNALGIAGVCPECNVRCVRLLGPDPEDGQGGGVVVPLSADVTAFDQQRSWNVAVSSNSWGYVDRFPVPHLLALAISALITEGRDGKGAIVVFAAGNDAREVFDDELYGIPGLITVGAINAFDEAAQFSNYGAGVDVVAPAGSLTTDITGADGDDPGDFTPTFGGTSSACPVVAGVAALLVSAAPDKTGAEIAAALIASARPAPFALPDDAGHDPLYGYGIVDPYRALDRLGAVPDPGPEPSPEPSPEAQAEPDEADVSGADAAEPDATEAPAPPAKQDDGCASGPTPPWLALPLLFALFVMRRRRAHEVGALSAGGR